MDKIRLGIIGTGSVVREIYQHLYFTSSYSHLIEVCAACDVDIENLEWFAGKYGITSKYANYREMITAEDLDAVAVNTPDHLHMEPVLHAFEQGLDVLVPKPTAHTVVDAHAMIQGMRTSGRFLGVDFHKREDPAVKTARAGCRSGKYGKLQVSTWHMLDRLLVADTNYTPRFFASADFAEQNSPLTFLTSHMADTFITITGERPWFIRATGYRHKLPSLKPVAVNGYDLIDTEIRTYEGSTAHIVSGWALPNTAHCLTVQSGRMIFSEGMIDLWNEWYGFREITAQGNEVPNIQFMNFEESGAVTGYGMDSPGKLIEYMARIKSGEVSSADSATVASPEVLGLFTALVCACAGESLTNAEESAPGVFQGCDISARDFLSSQIGDEEAKAYFS
ncbi:MAG: Gfo/Idh/MocA family oxidoreductase [Spirochaetales bacterium]|jgi:predicted dehydrogenase|nr:Gfo/Idh/MocA family oxidoreductase [Spirochaetales bacterium]